MLSAINIQMCNGVKGPTIIVDEIDRFSETQQDKLVAFIEATLQRLDGMVIMTTNHLNKVDGALCRRSMPYRIASLLPKQALNNGKIQRYANKR